MNRPSLDQLMKKVNSKYALVIVASKRARMLTNSGSPGDGDKVLKPVSQALQEIAEGKIDFLLPKGRNK
ncbi:MAG: DNA-directed RNA polymerase subunit omega [Clostridia bacterium]|nr:DNA-directed RNA polymerase subunit omega [Clostridia bacterium]